MKTEIRTYFNSMLALPDEEWSAMDKCFTLVEFKKGDILLAENRMCDFIGFIQSGLIRFYQIKEGNEKVTAFWFPGDFLSNYRSFVSGQPSEHHIEALSDGSYWQLKRVDLFRLYDAYPLIDRLGRIMAERLYLLITQRLDNFLSITPEERYQILQRKNSRLLQDIPQYMVAAYLGVSPETLSRIRKRLQSK